MDEINRWTADDAVAARLADRPRLLLLQALHLEPPDDFEQLASARAALLDVLAARLAALMASSRAHRMCL